MITALQIATACNCTLPRAENWRGVLATAMSVFAIDTPARMAAFLAQVAHESGRLAYTRDGLLQFVPLVPDFEAAPEMLEAPKWAALSAGWYWHSRRLNALADHGDYMRITRRINGGTTGYADRLALWDGAKGALGVA